MWLLFLVHCSLVSVRHVPLYATVAAPLIASELSAWWTAAAPRFPKSSIFRILYQVGEDIAPSFRWMSVWPAVVVVALDGHRRAHSMANRFSSGSFSRDDGASELRLVALGGRLLTPDQWGDYLIYCFYPQQRVFVDGRSDFYGETLGKEYLHLLQGAYDWRAIMQRYGFDRALLPVEWPLTSILKLDPSWQVVRDDGKALLFVRRGQ